MFISIKLASTDPPELLANNDKADAVDGERTEKHGSKPQIDEKPYQYSIHILAFITDVPKVKYVAVEFFATASVAE